MGVSGVSQRYDTLCIVMQLVQLQCIFSKSLFVRRTVSLGKGYAFNLGIFFIFLGKFFSESSG